MKCLSFVQSFLYFWENADYIITQKKADKTSLYKYEQKREKWTNDFME